MALAGVKRGLVVQLPGLPPVVLRAAVTADTDSAANSSESEDEEGNSVRRSSEEGN